MRRRRAVRLRPAARRGCALAAAGRAAHLVEHAARAGAGPAPPRAPGAARRDAHTQSVVSIM